MRKLWTCIYTHLSPRGHDFIGSFLLSLSCSLAAPPQALPHIELGLLGKIKSGMEQQFSIYPTSAVSRHVVVQWIWIRIWPNSLSNFLLLFFPASKASTTIKAVAQKPETFRVATFYAQKNSGRRAQTVSHNKPKMGAFTSHDIAKEYIINVLVLKYNIYSNLRGARKSFRDKSWIRGRNRRENGKSSGKIRKVLKLCGNWQ